MLILLCHSETVRQTEDIWLGTDSSTLSPAGRRAAEDFASHDRVHNDRAYVAPAEHVQEFAHIVLTNPYELVDAFTDRSMGTLTGRPYRETMGEFPRRNWLAWQRSYWIAPPEGESLFEIADRVLGAFRTKILPVKATETVVVVAAPDVLRVIIGSLQRIEEPAVPKIQIEVAVPYVIHGDL